MDPGASVHFVHPDGKEIPGRLVRMSAGGFASMAVEPDGSGRCIAAQYSRRAEPATWHFADLDHLTPRQDARR